MKYDIRAKPTTYNGRLFRSRLEARWAAYFDLLGWAWEYEPFDLNGWSPDFAISCKYPKSDGQRFELCKKVIVGERDVFNNNFKCECGWAQVGSAEIGSYKLCYNIVKDEIIKEYCLVEVKPIVEFDKEIARKMTEANKERFELLLLGTSPLLNAPYPYLGWMYENDLKWSCGWDKAIFTNTVGFAHSCGSYGCRIKGDGGGSNHDLLRNFFPVNHMWIEAANKVMFLKPTNHG